MISCKKNNSGRFSLAFPLPIPIYKRVFIFLFVMDPRSLVLFGILILLSMFFSGSETAFTAVPLHKVNALRKQKKS